MATGDKPPEPSQDTASLVTRLAGPSTTKAGLAKDQTEINRIIAEASKGSKFYENEKKKDQELTRKISRILKQRDEMLKGADTQKAEKVVDQILVELESTRDLSQYIVHIDMDAFFANVELLHQPELTGKPFGVGRGVLTTASYEARKYGVRSGMPGFIAKKLCPDLILVPINFPRYTENSEKVMNVFRRYDPNLHAAGCDEAYLNITPYCQEHDIGPEECVQEMRAKVEEETNLTASAGIAPNKMLAKVCSDKNKPNGQFLLPFNRKSIIAFMHDLSIRKIQGVGRVNERLLDAIGIKTCGDIFTHRTTIWLMDRQFGLNFLLRTYLGIASNVVRPGQREERKSVGSERTFNTLNEKEKILQKLEEIALELEGDLAHLGFTGKTVTLKYKLDTYQVFTRAKSFTRWISTKKEDLFSIGKELLIPELPLSIRLIGLRVTKLKDLRAPSQEAGGIKRFFESIDASPSKKRKLQDEFTDLAEKPQGGAELEEAMPGFYEHDEEDVEMGVGIDIVDDILEDHPQSSGITTEVSSEPPIRLLPPTSAPGRGNADKFASRNSGNSAPDTAYSPGASSSRLGEAKPAAEIQPVVLGTLECPICGKIRGAILDAQTKAQSPVNAFKTKERKSATRSGKKINRGSGFS